MIDETLTLLSQKSNEGKVTWSFTANNQMRTLVNDNWIYLTEQAPDQIYQLRLTNSGQIQLEEKTFVPTEKLFGEARDLFKTTAHKLLGPQKAIEDLNNTLRSL